jgi:hypothetical protein
MDCPLTNQGPYTFTFRIGAKRARKSSQSNISRSLSTNHMRAFSVTRHAETGFKQHLAHPTTVAPPVARPERRIRAATLPTGSQAPAPRPFNGVQPGSGRGSTFAARTSGGSLSSCQGSNDGLAFKPFVLRQFTPSPSSPV